MIYGHSFLGFSWRFLLERINGRDEQEWRPMHFMIPPLCDWLWCIHNKRDHSCRPVYFIVGLVVVAFWHGIQDYGFQRLDMISHREILNQVAEMLMRCWISPYSFIVQSFLHKYDFLMLLSFVHDVFWVLQDISIRGSMLMRRQRAECMCGLCELQSSFQPVRLEELWLFSE